jgi:hypothetical protein
LKVRVQQWCGCVWFVSADNGSSGHLQPSVLQEHVHVCVGAEVSPPGFRLVASDENDDGVAELDVLGRRDDLAS